MRFRSAHLLLCRWLSGALGRELQATDLPVTPAEWQHVLRLSSTHLVTPLLHWVARTQGYLSSLPPNVVAFLEAVYTLNRDRNRQCLDQLAHLTQALNGIGVQPVLLKGAATLVSDLYPTLGERMIGDIDVLIPAPRLPDILERLADAGYRRMGTGGALPKAKDFAGFSGHHYPRIDSPDWPVGVELHICLVDSSAARLLSAEEIFQDAKPLSWRGGEVLLPSPTHFVMHNVIHAFVKDFSFLGWLSLRQLFEFVHANQIYGERVDWNAVVQRFHELGYRKALSEYTAFANAYLGFPPPPGLTVHGWNRWRPFLHGTRVVAVFRPLSMRTRHLCMGPHRLNKLNKLLTVDLYSRLWHECVAMFHQT
ncbi:MAG: nucleotidyltransferase family protein [Candidatus Competibacteraceae bacterium]